MTATPTCLISRAVTATYRAPISAWGTALEVPVGVATSG